MLNILYKYDFNIIAASIIFYVRRLQCQIIAYNKLVDRDFICSINYFKYQFFKYFVLSN